MKQMKLNWSSIIELNLLKCSSAPELLKLLHVQEINDDYLVATAMVFFLAGYDNTSTLLAWTCYNLALNPEVQEKLQQEVDEAFDKSEGKLPDYTIIQAGLWFV